MQLNFADAEYKNRRRKTKREKFLEKMDKTVPWDEWAEKVRPYYPKGIHGRRPHSIERMLKMYMLRTWFGLSDLGTEEAVYDSYSMKKFMQLDFFSNEQVPDSSTLYRFRKLLARTGLDEYFKEESGRLMKISKIQVP